MAPFLAQIPPPPTDGISLGPLDVQFYGLLIALGAFIALRLTVARYERFGGDPEIAERVALWALGFGVLGTRIGYVIPRFFDNPSGTPFVEDPLAILRIWEGGLALFGGLILGSAAGIWLLRRWNGDVPAFADAVAPALPLAQAIGRWGNYFNQELYGSPTDLPWAVRIERADPRYPGVETFHPTFLYESLGNLLLVVVLLRIDRTGRLRRGALMWCYLIGYGALRTLVESLRVDTDARYFGLSRNNWIAIATVLVGLAGLSWWQQHQARRAEAEREDAGDGDGREEPGALDATDHEGASDGPDDEDELDDEGEFGEDDLDGEGEFEDAGTVDARRDPEDDR